MRLGSEASDSHTGQGLVRKVVQKTGAVHTGTRPSHHHVNSHIQTHNLEPLLGSSGPWDQENCSSWKQVHS